MRIQTNPIERDASNDPVTARYLVAGVNAALGVGWFNFRRAMQAAIHLRSTGRTFESSAELFIFTPPPTRMDPPLHEETKRASDGLARPGLVCPVSIRFKPRPHKLLLTRRVWSSLHSVPKEFFDPLRSGDPPSTPPPSIVRGPTSSTETMRRNMMEMSTRLSPS